MPFGNMSRHEALIVAHGQPGNPAPPEVALAKLAAQVQEHMPGWHVRSATLAAPGALEAAAKEMTPGALVYPLFMAEGWFVRTALPKRLTNYPLRTMRPFGLEADLPTIGVDAVLTEIERRGWVAEQTHVVLAAHGSGRSAYAAHAAHAFSDRLAAKLPVASVRTGFVEQSPTISVAASGLGQNTICLPFFACNGDHYTHDIPQGLQEAEFRGVLLPVLGLQPQVPDLIARSLKNAAKSKAAA